MLDTHFKNLSRDYLYFLDVFHKIPGFIIVLMFTQYFALSRDTISGRLG